jgi:hypothetical protein
MGACAKLSYNGVTQDIWEKMKAKVHAELGITIDSDSGKQTEKGFTIAWNYNPTNHNLSLQCVDSPWYAPCSVINSKINELVEPMLKEKGVKMTSMM